MQIVADLLLLLGILGAAYLFFASFAVRTFPSGTKPTGLAKPGITVLKPLQGAEPHLDQNLRSFLQAGQEVQVICGVRDPSDPSRGVVERLVSEGAGIELVVDPSVHGQNPKVSNLMNMLGGARNPCLVVADSDIRVGPGYYEALQGSLEEDGVGLVTCLYRARPEPGLWSALGALWVNYTFLPSVLVGEALGVQKGCFGATLCLRRETLERIGGLAPLRDLLADDYALGAAVRAAGLRVVLSGYLVDMVVAEEGPGTLLTHELRWLRTIRSLRPLGYAGLVLTHPVPLSTLALLLSGFSPLSVSVLGLALLARVILVLETDRRLGLPHASPLLVLVRDFLSFGLFLLGFWGSRVGWRGRDFRLQPDGSLLRSERSRP